MQGGRWGGREVSGGRWGVDVGLGGARWGGGLEGGCEGGKVNIPSPVLNIWKTIAKFCKTVQVPLKAWSILL